ncbi:hypothetical protein SERLA73DRAFT_73027 [Serpula lacrymans var. lacrymans S7.3]|uniref:Uncharacterized protein n=1 Tax=Serpula lacrymans var. lacrymans (strain S7.3) TaxID=936435 RepID=F8PWI4_SERL3|nr:hypothetical protein SERLA73DRAFT_73027 [Serpula lacrymans var. lacrymans S7.3]
MAWGIFYRHPQQSSWDHAPSTVHDDRSLGFIKQYGHDATLPSGSPDSSKSAYPSASQQYPPGLSYASHSPPFAGQTAQSPSSMMSPASTPAFRRPLSDSFRDDPAFSADPTLHPFFPLTAAASYRQVPSKSPMQVPVALSPPVNPPTPSPPPSPNRATIGDESASIHEDQLERAYPSSSEYTESHTTLSLSAFTHDTFSSSSALTSPQSEKPSLPSFFSPPPAYEAEISLPLNDPPPMDRPAVVRNVSAPAVRQEMREDPPPRSATAPIHADGSNRAGIGRRGHPVQHHPNWRALDRIDELDESDPFGGWHHRGPYEAIGSNLAELGPPHKYDDTGILGGDLQKLYLRKTSRGPSKQRRIKPPRVDPPKPGVFHGLSLNLRPGQILPRRVTYDTRPGVSFSAEPFSDDQILHAGAQPTNGSPSRPEHSRSRSVPVVKNRAMHAPTSNPRVPRYDQVTRGTDPPHLHQVADYSHPGNSAPTNRHHAPADDRQSPTNYVGHQEWDQNRKSSRPVVMTPQSTSSAEELMYVTDRPLPPPPPKASHHSPPIQSNSTAQGNTFGGSNTAYNSKTSLPPSLRSGPPKVRHLPKHLVMPTPLQPPPPPLPQADYQHAQRPPFHHQQRYQQHEHAYSHGPPHNPSTYPDQFPPPTQEIPQMVPESRRLRKRSGIYPPNTPLPFVVPLSSTNSIPLIAGSGSKKAKETEKANLFKEGSHRRKLSKRRNDI